MLEELQAIPGVQLRQHRRIADARGDLSEIHRDGQDALVAVQWNIVRSQAGVLRGVHVHAEFDELYVLAAGSAFLLLKDARRTSPTLHREVVGWIDADDDVGVVIPHGVAHAVVFTSPSVMLVAMDHFWSGQEELGCSWTDPAIATPWPMQRPILSDRDAQAGSYEHMMDSYERRRASLELG